MPLSDVKIRGAKPRRKPYKLFDSRGQGHLGKFGDSAVRANGTWIMHAATVS
jgi:hypothetical protein